MAGISYPPPGADIVLRSSDQNAAPIADATSNCESNFSRCMLHLESTGEERTATELRRLEAKFLDWRAYLGVFAQGSASLDHRLGRHAQQRDLVLLALDMLDMSLAQMNVNPDDSESDESTDGEKDRRTVELGGVRKSINELSRLAVHIRLSPTSSLDARVQAFRAKKAAEIAPFEALAMLAVNRLYPDSTDSIRHLLAKAMTDRYARLLYWKYHDKKLRFDRRRKNHVPAQRDVSSQGQNPLVPPAAPHRSRTPTRPEISNPTEPQESHVSFGTGLLSETIPSNPASRIIIPPREGDIPIQRRAGASTVLGSKARFPEPPKLKDGESSLPCPFCRKIFPGARFKDVVWWRQHVNDDLAPFVCLVDGCSESYKYASRAEWKAHTAHHHDNFWSRSRIPRTRGHMPTKRDASGSGDISSTGEPTDDCPLCCLPLTKPGNDPNQAATTQKPPGQPGQGPSASGLGAKKAKKSVRFDAAASNPAPASERLDQASQSSADVAPFSTPRSKDSLLDHIAEHMQFLALLTVRLAGKRVAIKSDDRSFSSAQEASSDGTPRHLSTLDTDIEFPYGDSPGDSPEGFGDVPMSNMGPEDAGPMSDSKEEEILVDRPPDGTLSDNWNSGAKPIIGPPEPDEEALMTTSGAGVTQSKEHGKDAFSTNLETAEPVIKVAIDPRFGDLLPLPPSRLASPLESTLNDEIPPLPESRPETPPQQEIGKEDMMLLLKTQDQAQITPELVKEIAASFDEDVMMLLLERLGDQVEITADVVKAVARNQRSGKGVMTLLLKKRRNEIPKVLHLAAKNGYEAVTKLLLDMGADKEAKNEWEETPLHLAAENGHKAVTKLLLDMGADKEAKNELEETPLHLAAEHGHEAVTKLLLDMGADKKAKNKWEETPLHLAAKNGHEAVTKLLLDMDADKEAKNKWEETPLHSAVENGHEAVTKLFLDIGADKEAKNEWKETPLHLAAKNGHKAVTRRRRSQPNVSASGAAISPGEQPLRRLSDAPATAAGRFSVAALRRLEGI